MTIFAVEQKGEPMADLIDRQAAIDAICKHGTALERGGILVLALVEHKQMTIDLLEDLPSAQPEMDCQKCIFCGFPGFKQFQTAQPQRWIPVTARPMDTEERLELSEKLGYDIEYNEALIYTSQLPDDGQEVLTCDSCGNVRIDTFENDPDYGCGFEENGDMDGIVAWMPLPEPWKGERE